MDFKDLRAKFKQVVPEVAPSGIAGVVPSLIKGAVQGVTQRVPEKFKNTLFLRSFGFFKVPLIFAVAPRVEEFSGEHVVIRIPLNRITRNHLSSMYFGVLTIGADCAGGIIAMKAILDSGQDVSLVFKDLKAEFLKRAEGDTFFTCNDGQLMRDAVHKTLETGERENVSVQVTATVPEKSGSEPVARFTLTLSLKRQ